MCLLWKDTEKCQDAKSKIEQEVLGEFQSSRFDNSHYGICPHPPQSGGGILEVGVKLSSFFAWAM